MARIGFDIMCGIAGFSLSRNSVVNPRKLSHALLCGIESRGSQASGFAWDDGKSSGVFKCDVAGSSLSLRGMPRSASSVILHTRYATHGSTKVMANNHPVMSPDNSIALVHNGVIYNHSRVREEFAQFSLPEVDTSVIPAIVQEHGWERFDMLDGDASVAWLDESDKGVLRVGRLSHSPLFVAQVKDGSFVFASTEQILLEALAGLKLSVVWFQKVAERTLFEVFAGRIISEFVMPETSPEFEEKVSYSAYGKYRGMTAGGVKSAWSDYSDAYIAGDDLAPFEADLEQEFQAWLSSKYEVDGFFYDYDGTFVGDVLQMREMFEDYRYNEYWAEKSHGFNPYSASNSADFEAVWGRDDF